MTDVISLLPHLEAESLRGFMCSVFPKWHNRSVHRSMTFFFCRCLKNSIAHCFTTAPTLLVQSRWVTTWAFRTMQLGVKFPVSDSGIKSWYLFYTCIFPTSPTQRHLPMRLSRKKSGCAWRYCDPDGRKIKLWYNYWSNLNNLLIL